MNGSTTEHSEITEARELVRVACEAHGFRVPKTDEQMERLAANMRLVLQRVETYNGRKTIFGSAV